MEQKQAIALFIVIAMVFSSIGFVVLYNDPSSSNEPVPPAGENPPIQATPIEFEAHNIDANIVELLPAIRLVAVVDETNLTALDNRVRSIPGVKNVVSGFQNNEAGLLYRADISLDAASAHADIVSALSQDPLFHNISYVVYALLQLPRDIQLVTVNADLNATKSFSFGDAAVDGLVAPQSRADDAIQVDALVTLSDNVVQSKTIFEVQNLSAIGFEGSTPPDAPLRLKIASMENHLFASFEIPSGKLKDQELAKANLENIPDVNAVHWSFFPAVPQIELAVDSNQLSTDTLRDINAFIAFRANRLVEEIHQPVFSALIEIDALSDVSKLETDWKTLLRSHGLFEKGAFRPQVSRANLDLSLVSSSVNTGPLAAQALAQLNNDLNAFGFEFRQPVLLDVNSLDINEMTYPVDSSLLPVRALVQPGKSAGMLVDADVRYQVERGKITNLQVMEN